MKSTITNAAAITVLEPIDNNYSTGAGDISVGGAIVIAKKGTPFTPLTVYGNTTNIEDKFGTPLAKSATGMEGLRHVHDASMECSYVQTVRVVNSLTYRYPSISFLQCLDSGASWESGTEYLGGEVVEKDGVKWLCAYPHTADDDNAPEDGAEDWLEYTGQTTTYTHRYDEDVTVSEGAFLSIWPIDGDASTTRTVQISDVDSDAKRFTLTFYDTDSLGEIYELESHEVGIDEDDTDDMGLSAYIETVLLRDSSYFRCDFVEGTTWEELQAILEEIATTLTVENSFAFVGGTAGDDPEISDWQIGVNVLRDERVSLNLLFAAGIYEEDVLVSLADLADERHIAFFFDVPPALTCEGGIEWIGDMGLKSRHARAYYSPYSASDQWRGGSTVWGVSGAMAAAKARCNSVVTYGVTPGVHYSPAGEKRGYLSRTGLTALHDDVLNDYRDSLYDARINPVVPMSSGGCTPDDDLTCWFYSNYLRFGWVNDILDYIDLLFYNNAAQLKFEPDGLTKSGLTDMMTSILDSLVTSGALVEPRDADRDGTDPYTLSVEQIEIDLWKVTWSVCVTGAARRIAGQPYLIK